MAKELNGAELQGFIKERQLRQVRNLRQAHGIIPKLLIIKSPAATPVIDTYVRMKERYAADILIEVEVMTVVESDMKECIKQANIDSNTHGIIVQLPLENASQTEEICNTIDAGKDVDGLSIGAFYPSATAQAIDWLLAGYNVALEDKHIAIVGAGKLVGNPLARMWKERGLAVTILDEHSDNTHDVLAASDVIVSATGVPHLVQTGDVKHGAVVVDAGTASENGQQVGDVDDEVRDRSDVTITPVQGGVGPLTIAVLFDHVIEVCGRRAGLLR